MSLDGGDEDQVSASLSASVLKAEPGLLVVRHREDGNGGLPDTTQMIEGLPGQGASVLAYSLPPDLAFSMLDLRTFAAVQELFDLRNQERSIEIRISGPAVSLTTLGTLSAEELENVLPRFALLVARVRDVGALRE